MNAKHAVDLAVGFACVIAGYLLLEDTIDQLLFEKEIENGNRFRGTDAPIRLARIGEDCVCKNS